MSLVKNVNANRIITPGQAGELIIARLAWKVTPQVDTDQVLIGYLPANCRIHAPASAVIADGATGAMTLDVFVDVIGQKIVSADAITAATYKSTAVPAAAVIETIGKTSDNRGVYLNLSTAPTVAGGYIYVDLAYYDPGVQ